MKTSGMGRAFRRVGAALAEHNLAARWLMLAVLTLAPQMAMAAITNTCNWSLNFTSVGQTIQVNTSTCDAVFQGMYGGLHVSSSEVVIYDPAFAVGVNFSSGQPEAEDITGSNGGVYTFSHNLKPGRGILSGTLKTAPTGNSGTITL